MTVVSMHHLDHVKVSGDLVTWLGVFLLLALPDLNLITPGNADAETFRCLDESGSPVLTDSPAQLKDCTPLLSNVPEHHVPPPSKAGGSFTPSREPADFEPGPPTGQEEPEVTDEESEANRTAQSSPTITVPLTKVGGSLVVHAQLNGTKDVQLILDTGATMTVLSYDVAIELGVLSGSDNSINTVNTAGGQVQVNMARLEEIRVGSAKAKNVAVVIHDLPDGLPQVSGLLGMSFLSRFLITLDSDKGVLHLSPRRRSRR